MKPSITTFFLFLLIQLTSRNFKCSIFVASFFFSFSTLDAFWKIASIMLSMNDEWPGKVYIDNFAVHSLIENFMKKLSIKKSRRWNEAIKDLKHVHRVRKMSWDWTFMLFIRSLFALLTCFEHFFFSFSMLVLVFFFGGMLWSANIGWDDDEG